MTERGVYPVKCKVCGAESGKYPLCWDCNRKKETGEIIKCSNCGRWHYAASPCEQVSKETETGNFLYEPKKKLISKSEQAFYEALLQAVPSGYFVFPQINLATFIERTDDARFHNELFRNVDFLVTDSEYKPTFVVEINDQTHLTNERKERDEKVCKICEEAGIPILTLWTSYGVNGEYIQSRAHSLIDSLPAARIHHYSQKTTENQGASAPNAEASGNIEKKGACYIATCVYGAYDTPQVWVLRRYRDTVLSSTGPGRAFIRFYYYLSPKIVRVFGEHRGFRRFFKRILDKIVDRLVSGGFEDTAYTDQ